MQYYAVIKLIVMFHLPKSVLDWLVRRYEKRKWSKFVFPVINATFPSLTASDLVSVQPMQEPAGTVFYLDFRYTVPTYSPIEEYFKRMKEAHQSSSAIIISA